MEDSRIKNTTRNMIAGVVYRVINLLFPFIINTIIIRTLGVEYLGLNTLFASILQVLGLTELGFGSAMVFSMYEPVAKNDTEKVSALLALYRKVYLIIGGIILIGGLICIPILPKIIKGDIPDGLNIYILFIFSLTNTVISYFLFAYRSSLFMANQRKDIVEKIKTVIEITMNLSKIVILVITRDYYLFCLMQPLYTVVNSILTFFISKKMYPGYRCFGKVSKEEKKSIFSRVFGLSINKLCNVISTSFDSIIISSFLGLTVLGQYNNYFVIVNAVMFFMYIITDSAGSSIGNSMVCETLEKNYEDFSVFQFGFNLISGWASICVLCLIQPFIRLWLGEDLMFGEDIAIIFSVYMFLVLSNAVFMTYREAGGIFAHDKIRPFVEAGTNLILNIVLVQFIGVAGVMISTIITMGIMRTIWGSYYLFNEYFTKYSRFEYLMKMLYHVVITALAGALAYFLCTNITVDNNILQLIINLGICIVVTGSIYFVCYFRKKEFKRCLSLVKSILRR